MIWLEWKQEVQFAKAWVLNTTLQQLFSKRAIELIWSNFGRNSADGFWQKATSKSTIWSRGWFCLAKFVLEVFLYKCTCSSATSSYHNYLHILIGRSNFLVRTMGRKVSRASHAPLSLKLPSQPYSFSDNYDFFWFLLFLLGTVETISPQNLDRTLHDSF